MEIYYNEKNLINIKAKDKMVFIYKGCFMRFFREVELWKNVIEEEWEDWRWQARNRINNVETLSKIIHMTEEEKEEVKKVISKFPMDITPYYASLMDIDDPACPIRKQAVPTIMETYYSVADIEDPLAEDEHSPVPGLTHRYPDRVLFLITDQCAMYCRHCTRRRFTEMQQYSHKLTKFDIAFIISIYKYNNYIK